MHNGIEKMTNRWWREGENNVGNHGERQFRTTDWQGGG